MAPSFIRLLLIFALAGIGGASVAPCQDGLRRLSGQHIQLTTDVASEEESKTLVESFDAAVPQWESFWQLPPGSLDDWKVDAHVIRDTAAFRRLGLIPGRVPDFPFGYALGNRLWVIAQKSEYYTRHLLLHEGVHALAFSQFGGAGPSWFMEGTAELLSVHEGSGTNVQINRVPVHRDAVPYWGRFKLLTQRREQSGVPALNQVLGYPRDLKSDVESYGWSWAVAMLLYAYPEYRDVLLQAARAGRDTGPGFNLQLRKALKDWPVIVARWRLMCHDLNYGFDWSRERVDLSMKDQLWGGNKKSFKQKIRADRGWQSLGVRLAPGTRLTIKATGQTILASEPKPWISESHGITFRYHRGRPLGQLLAVLVPNVSPDVEMLPDLEVLAITDTALQIKQHCWLLFRVNDYVAELADNQGAYDIEVSKSDR